LELAAHKWRGRWRAYRSYGRPLVAGGEASGGRSPPPWSASRMCGKGAVGAPPQTSRRSTNVVVFEVASMGREGWAYRGSLPPDSKFVSIMCRARMVSTRDNRIYTGSGLRGVIPYVQCRAIVFPVLGVFVVGVTNWSGEGVGPKSLGMAFDL
jgi:hypothetical protein